MAQTRLKEVEKINETVTKKTFGKQTPIELNVRELYPPTMVDIGESVLKILTLPWPILLLLSNILLGTLRGFVAGVENGLSRAAKSYRKKW